MFGQQLGCREAQVGLSIETIEVMNQQMSILEASYPNQQSQFVDFSQKMLDSFVNFASSFAQTPDQRAMMGLNVLEGFVPLSVLQNWHRTFIRRLTSNPFFWK